MSTLSPTSGSGDPAERPRGDEEGDARLEPRRGHVEAAQRDPLPDQGQGGDRSRPPLRLHRAVAGSSEFFLRKAIGWALRQYAWTDPAEVRRYVAANEARLSGLSKREALKNIGARPDGRHPRPGRRAACRACSSISPFGRGSERRSRRQLSAASPPLGPGDKVEIVRRSQRGMARGDCRGGEEARLVDSRRAAARARAGARSLAHVRADQARPDRLAGREGDGARRRPPACQVDGHGAAATTGSTSNGCAPMPSKPPSNASARRCPSLPSRPKLDAILRDWPEGRALYFADEGGGEPLSRRRHPGRRRS